MRYLIPFLAIILAGCAQAPASKSRTSQAEQSLVVSEPQCPPDPAWEKNGSVPIPESFIEAFPRGTQHRTLNQIQLIFDRNKASMYSIYGRALRDKPCFRGVVHIAVALNPNGLVAGVLVIRSSTGDSEFDQNIAARISKIQFESVSGGGYYVFTYPILFTSH